MVFFVLIQLIALLLPIILPVIVVVAIVIIIFLLKKYRENEEYKNSAYYQITGHSYASVKDNLGLYGEYLTYKNLKHFENLGAKFLFNVYIPKHNGGTTEIDVIMIFSKGVFVIESKNYSGWIFGSESQKKWCQTLHVGFGKSQKVFFYNPIMQNRSHINHLEMLLEENLPMWSVIVFSDRCTLKKIQVDSADVCVTNRYNVTRIVSEMSSPIEGAWLDESKILALYNKLYPYTQIDKNVRTQHIANVHNHNILSVFAQQSPPAHVHSSAKNAQAGTSELKTVVRADVETTHLEVTTMDGQTLVDELKKTETVGVSSVEPSVRKCPRCNGNLVLRTATRGENVGKQFYGCSNYPQCKYIQDITEL